MMRIQSCWILEGSNSNALAAISGGRALKIICLSLILFEEIMWASSNGVNPFKACFRASSALLSIYRVIAMR